MSFPPASQISESFILSAGNSKFPSIQINVHKMLSAGKFSVFLASFGDSHSSLYAMKVIPYENSEPNPFYFNEIQYADLTHPNIITPKHFEIDRNLISNGQEFKSSIILSEYACNFDFYHAVVDLQIKFDEKLARTYFRQLITGLEFLHSKNIAHLDLKLENLMLDTNFNLRIIDFDNAKNVLVHKKFNLVGSANYRAPEIILERCKNAFAADIYSAGILLFILISGGIHPYTEEEAIEDFNFFHAFLKDLPTFWEVHESLQGFDFWKPQVKKLIEDLCCLDASKRMTIQEIKANEWFNGEIYNEEEVKDIMSQYYRN